MRPHTEMTTAVLETIDALVVVLDRRGRITYFNRACEKLTGYSKGEVLGRPIFDFLLPERYVEPVKQVFQNLVMGSLPSRFENPWVTKAGEERVISWSNSFVTDERGRVTQVIGTGLDITEQVETQEALRARSRELEALFNIASILGQPESFEEKATRALEVLADVAQVDRVILRLPDDVGEGLRLVAAAGPKVREVAPNPLQAYGDGITGLAFQEREPVLANDYPSHPHTRPQSAAQGVKSAFALPIEAHGRLLGTLSLDSWRPNSFGTKRVEFITAIANEMGSLLENARLTEALRRSEELYRSLVELAEAGVARFDLKGRRLFANEALARRYGKPVEELVQGTLGDNVTAEERKQARELFDRCVQTRKPVSGITTETRADGKVCYVRGVYTPIFGPDGEPTAVQVTSLDITEQVETQAALRRRSRELEALFHIARILAQPGAFQEKTTRILEEMVRVAQGDRAVLRMADEEAQGLRLVAVAGAAVDEVPPSSVVPYGRGLSGPAFQRGEPVIANDYASYPERVLEVVAQGMRSAVSVPIKAGDRTLGTINIDSRELDHFTPERVRLLESIANGMGPLLENARLVEALRRSEELYRSLVDATGSVVVRVNREGKRTFVEGDTVGMYGRTQEDLLAGEFGDNTIPEDREKAWALLQETFRTGRPVRGVVTRKKLGENLRYISVNWEPIRDAEGNVVEVQTTSTDVTDQIEAERRRMEAQRLEALASMAGGIAHDVNNVLAMIVLWANIAQVERDGAEAHEALENVIKAAQDGAESMRRLQRFATPAKPGRQELVDLNAIGEECIEFTRPMWKSQAEAKNVHVDLKRYYGDVPKVRGNAAELREVVVNLIKNAVEAMPRGGTLTLRTYRAGDKVCVSVSDTGVGISEEEMGHIFDPFYTTKGEEGSGLGLSAVQSIVVAHGGEVELQSAEGEGSTFVVALPMPAGEVGPEEAAIPRRQRVLGSGR